MPPSELAIITPVNAADLPPFGGGIPARPPHLELPIALPPVPPGVTLPEPPPTLPPSGGIPDFPIQIPDRPDKPITLPPGAVWPPLNPSDGVSGKAIVLAIVLGTGKWRWIVIDTTLIPQPK